MSAPIRISDIPIYRPEEQSIQETLSKAKVAANEIPSVLKRAGVVGVAALFGMPVAALNVVKWAVWNPAERLYRGRVTTGEPIEVYLDAIVKNYLVLDAEAKAERYALQLINTGRVTQEALEAFQSVAMHCKKIDLSFAVIGFQSLEYFLSSTNVTKPYVMNFIGEYGKHALDELIQKKWPLPFTISEIHSFLRDYGSAFQWIDSPTDHELDDDAVVLLLKNNFDIAVSKKEYEDSVFGRKAYLIDYFSKSQTFLERFKISKSVISKQQLITLIECIGKIPSCQEFLLPVEGKLPEIVDLLKKHGFNPVDQFYKFKR